MNKEDIYASISGVIGATVLTLISDTLNTSYLNVYSGGGQSIIPASMSTTGAGSSSVNSLNQTLIRQNPNILLGNASPISSIGNSISGLLGNSGLKL